MVFITIGTQKQQFTRLFDMVEKSQSLQNKQIIAQIGNTNYENEKINTVRFLDQGLLEKYISEAEFVISHGGVGTIFTALKLKKKVLVVPRLKKYDEHKDNHQLEISKELNKEGYLLYLDENENLDDKIAELFNVKLKEYELDHSFVKKLEDNI